MITYPSTYGVFERRVKELCAIVHRHGGRVYVDGANMNALVGVAAPGEFGGDVSHLNLHKTFCIPHGGGGPGVGPVCVVADLVPYLPGHAAGGHAGPRRVGAVSAAPLGNAARAADQLDVHADDGRRGPAARATETAILSANYIAARLADHYELHYSGNVAGIQGGGVAHECILDLRPLKDATGGAQGVSAEDVAKRLIDYGFHAPTLELPGRRHADGRADRERVAGRARPLLRRDDRDPRRDRARSSEAPGRATTTRSSTRRTPRRRCSPPTGRTPYSREQAAYPLASLRGTQVLVAGRPGRQRLGRPQPLVLLPAAVAPTRIDAAQQVWNGLCVRRGIATRRTGARP